jgi:peptide/nickel transport system substrate-binding protein
MEVLAPSEVFYPKHMLKNLDSKQFYEWDFWIHPVGNGPFRYVRHVPKTFMELEANPDYYRKKPKIERLILKFGGSIPLTELMSGNVDVLLSINQVDIPKIAGDTRFRIYHNISHDLAFLEAIYWNKQSLFFGDPLVRQALTMAINRRELHKLFNLPNNIPIFDVIFTPRQFWRGELLEPLPYDPELAKQFLDKAGWTSQGEEGIRKRVGVEFKFVALVPTEAMEKAAVYVREQLRRIGVRMEVQNLEINLVRNKLKTGDYDAVFLTFPNWDGNKGLMTWFKKDNWLSHGNPRVARLFDVVEETANPDECERIYKELMPILQADLPITFLFPQIETNIVHRRVRGLNQDLQSDLFENIEHIWIEEEN